MDVHGMSEPAIELQRTPTDAYGRKIRGLQNRLRSSVDVRSSSRLFAGVHPVGR
jgi:hypothetical protein